MIHKFKDIFTYIDEQKLILHSTSLEILYYGFKNNKLNTVLTEQYS
jgi:hypothetical protein